MSTMSGWMRAGAAAAVVAVALGAGPARAAQCGNDATGFDGWLAAFKARAPGLGLPAPAVATALSGVGYNATTIRLDRSQRSFKLSFDDFYRRRVSSALIQTGQRMLQAHAGLFSRIESRFGVPPAVLVSIWGLETNYGRDGGGKHSIIGSLATLAYDCRRSAFFENELVNAIRIVAKGDMSPGEMVGGWAGEIGPMQFLPSSYVKFAVDFDGDGRRDLKRSVPDMLASTANYLKSYGWKAGQPWTPGTANYEVIRQWNKAEVYAQTIAVMSARMAGRQ